MKLQYRIWAWLCCLFTGWISVHHRLPQHKHKGVTLGILCFVLTGGYYPDTAVYSSYDNKWYATDDIHKDITEYVSHWRYSNTPRIFSDEWIINRRQAGDK